MLIGHMSTSSDVPFILRPKRPWDATHPKDVSEQAGYDINEWDLKAGFDIYDIGAAPVASGTILAAMGTSSRWQ